MVIFSPTRCVVCLLFDSNCFSRMGLIACVLCTFFADVLRHMLLLIHLVLFEWG